MWILTTVTQPPLLPYQLAAMSCLRDRAMPAASTHVPGIGGFGLHDMARLERLGLTRRQARRLYKRWKRGAAAEEEPHLPEYLECLYYRLTEELQLSMQDGDLSPTAMAEMAWERHWALAVLFWVVKVPLETDEDGQV